MVSSKILVAMRLADKDCRLTPRHSKVWLNDSLHLTTSALLHDLTCIIGRKHLSLEL